jgi:hypothetical protein
MINDSQAKISGVTPNGQAEQNDLHHRQGEDEQHHPDIMAQNHHQASNRETCVSIIPHTVTKLTQHSSTFVGNSSGGEHASFPLL